MVPHRLGVTVEAEFLLNVPDVAAHRAATDAGVGDDLLVSVAVA